jgi:hypothetical protein
MLATPTDDLVERMARKLASFRSTEHDWERYEPEARALTRIALEEAAQFVQDECHDYDDAHRIAAAIRELANKRVMIKENT